MSKTFIGPIKNGKAGPFDAIGANPYAFEKESHSWVWHNGNTRKFPWDFKFVEVHLRNEHWGIIDEETVKKYFSKHLPVENPNDRRYVVSKDGMPWSGGRGHYAFDTSVNPPRFVRSTRMGLDPSGWTMERLNEYVKRGYWKYITEEKFFEFFPNHKSKAPERPIYLADLGGKLFGDFSKYLYKVYDGRAFVMRAGLMQAEDVLSDGAYRNLLSKTYWREEITENEAFSLLGRITQAAPVAKKDDMTLVIGVQPNNPVRSKPLSIKKGSVYFNTTTHQVERVITIQDTSLIWSSSHKQRASSYPRSAFRKATELEVKAYLGL